MLPTRRSEPTASPLGDYNGDGKADILWRNEATGHVYMMLMNGLAISAQAMVYQESNTAWQLLGPWEYGQASGVLAAAIALPVAGLRRSQSSLDLPCGRGVVFLQGAWQQERSTFSAHISFIWRRVQ